MGGSAQTHKLPFLPMPIRVIMMELLTAHICILKKEQASKPMGQMLAYDNLPTSAWFPTVFCFVRCMHICIAASASLQCGCSSGYQQCTEEKNKSWGQMQPANGRVQMLAKAMEDLGSACHSTLTVLRHVTLSRRDFAACTKWSLWLPSPWMASYLKP